MHTGWSIGGRGKADQHPGARMGRLGRSSHVLESPDIRRALSLTLASATTLMCGIAASPWTRTCLPQMMAPCGGCATLSCTGAPTTTDYSSTDLLAPGMRRGHGERFQVREFVELE